MVPAVGQGNGLCRRAYAAKFNRDDTPSVFEIGYDEKFAYEAEPKIRRLDGCVTFMTADNGDAILGDLTLAQRAAVTHVDGPLLVLAGAGSGKTRTITRRMAYLAAQGIAPMNILAVTFTNKAAAEMRHRTLALLAGLSLRHGGAPTVSTFHSLCARLLREFSSAIGLPAAFGILDTADQLKLIKQALEKIGLSPENFAPARVLDKISGAKNRLQRVDAFAAAAAGYFDTSVARVYRVYEELLGASQAVDFDDLLLKTALLLRDNAEVRNQLQGRFRYILIDEYQDTNHAQFVIAHMLAMEHENICATGDPDQSIYAWRGANLSNILEFEKFFPRAKVVLLEQNYRSTKTILQAASSLISHNRQRKHKDLWTENTIGSKVIHICSADEKQEAREIVRRLRDWHEREGISWDKMAVFYRVNAISRVLEEALMEAGLPYQIVRGTEFYARKEVKDVLAYLKLLVNPDDTLSFQRVINVPARGLGGTSVSRLADYAAHAGISLPAACRRAEEVPGLTKRAVEAFQQFAALIDSLRLLAIPPACASHADRPPSGSPEVNQGAIGTNEFDPLYDPALAAEATACTELSNFSADADENSPPGPASHRDATGRSVSPHAGEGSGGSRRFPPVAAIMEEVIHRAGFIRESKTRTMDEESLQRQSNIQELINVATEYDLSARHAQDGRQNPSGSLSDYLTQVALVSDVDRLGEKSGAVTLMTLHAAKGLEFPVVAIVAMEEGILPHERAIGFQGRPQDVEEERRLCFVGMTRAMQQLILSHSCYRMIMGRSEGRVASRFLKEIPDECVVRIDLLAQERLAGSPGYRDETIDQARPLRTKPASYRDSARRSIAAAEPASAPARFRKGSLVRHQKFGVGRIAELTPVGEKTRVVVEFQSAGRRSLFLEHARLEPVDG